MLLIRSFYYTHSSCVSLWSDLYFASFLHIRRLWRFTVQNGRVHPIDVCWRPYPCICSLSCCTIVKKEDKIKCDNYTEISLFHSVYMVFPKVLVNRIFTYVKDFLDDYQCGFRRGRLITEQLFVNLITLLPV